MGLAMPWQGLGRRARRFCRGSGLEPSDARLRSPGEAGERAPRPERTVRSDSESVDDGVGVRVPARRGAAGRVERGYVVAVLATDRGEVAAGVDGGAGDGEGVDDGTEEAAVGIRVPASRGATGRVEGGDVSPRLAADRAEAATGVHGRAGDGEGLDDVTDGVRVPARDDTRGRIE